MVYPMSLSSQKWFELSLSLYSSLQFCQFSSYTSECQSTRSDRNWSYDQVHIFNYQVLLTRELTLHQCRSVKIQHLSLSLNDDVVCIHRKY